ncbi:MAG: tetratricopeptide repeat protein [Tepidisphaerales bacterium]
MPLQLPVLNVRPPRRGPSLLPWLVALAGMAVFALTLRGPYLYDDVPLLQEDPRVTTTGHFGLIWSRDYHFDLRTGDGSVDNLYRPLVTTTYHLQVARLGHGPLGLRIINLLLYGVVCGLVTRLGVLLAGPVGGLVGGLFFAVHPVHAEVLATVVGRAELLAAAGVLGGLLLFLSGPLTHVRAAGILFCSVVALLSKEQGLLMPALLLAAEPLRRRLHRPAVLPGGRPDSVAPAGRSPVTPMQTLILGVCLSVAGYIVLREQVLGLKFAWDRGFLDPAVQPMVWSTPLDRVLMPLVLLGQAVVVLVAPLKLSLDYSGAAIGPHASPADFRLYLGLAAALAVAAAGGWSVLRRRWDVAFALAALTGTWLLVGNVVSLIGVNFAERLLFLPSAFAAVLLGLFRPRRPLTVAVLGVYLTLLAVQAVRYSQHWSRPPLEVYAWTLERNPQSIRLYQLLADAQMKAGQLDAAADTIARGISTFPAYFGGYLQAGLIAERRERWDEAERYYVDAARVDPQRASGALLDFRARRAALLAPQHDLQLPAQPATRPVDTP